MENTKEFFREVVVVSVGWPKEKCEEYNGLVGVFGDCRKSRSAISLNGTDWGARNSAELLNLLNFRLPSYSIERDARLDVFTRRGRSITRSLLCSR